MCIWLPAFALPLIFQFQSDRISLLQVFDVTAYPYPTRNLRRDTWLPQIPAVLRVPSLQFFGREDETTPERGEHITVGRGGDRLEDVRHRSLRSATSAQPHRPLTSFPSTNRPIYFYHQCIESERAILTL